MKDKYGNTLKIGHKVLYDGKEGKVKGYIDPLSLKSSCRIYIGNRPVPYPKPELTRLWCDDLTELIEIVGGVKEFTERIGGERTTVEKWKYEGRHPFKGSFEIMRCSLLWWGYDARRNK